MSVLQAITEQGRCVNPLLVDAENTNFVDAMVYGFADWMSNVGYSVSGVEIQKTYYELFQDEAYSHWAEEQVRNSDAHPLHKAIEVAVSSVMERVSESLSPRDASRANELANEFLNSLKNPEKQVCNIIVEDLCRDVFGNMDAGFISQLTSDSIRQENMHNYCQHVACTIAHRIPANLELEATYDICEFLRDAKLRMPDVIDNLSAAAYSQCPLQSVYAQTLAPVCATLNGYNDTRHDGEPVEVHEQTEEFQRQMGFAVSDLVNGNSHLMSAYYPCRPEIVSLTDFVGRDNGAAYVEWDYGFDSKQMDQYLNEWNSVEGMYKRTFEDPQEWQARKNDSIVGYIPRGPMLTSVVELTPGLHEATRSLTPHERKEFFGELQRQYNERPWDLARATKLAIHKIDSDILPAYVKEGLMSVVSQPYLAVDQKHIQEINALDLRPALHQSLEALKDIAPGLVAYGRVNQADCAELINNVERRLELDERLSMDSFKELAQDSPQALQAIWNAIAEEQIEGVVRVGGHQFQNERAEAIAGNINLPNFFSIAMRGEFYQELERCAQNPELDACQVYSQALQTIDEAHPIDEHGTQAAYYAMRDARYDMSISDINNLKTAMEEELTQDNHDEAGSWDEDEPDF